MLKRKRKQRTLSEYPPGTFLDTDRGYFYVHRPKELRRVVTKRVLMSWSPPRLVKVPFSSLKGHRIIGKLKFRNGSLIKNYGDGKIYLIVDGKRRHIASPDYLSALDATHKDVFIVSIDEVELHPEGEILK